MGENKDKNRTNPLDKLVALGQQIRERRKGLRISATVTAEAAGISRVTLHRIEKGKPSVAMGAYLKVMAALNIDFGVMKATPPQPTLDLTNMIPARIPLNDYPQLKLLAWQVHGVDTLTPPEALSIYERNWRHMDERALETNELQLINALRLAFNGTSSGTI
ncbi:MAG: helix-turn-helix domain-containing protein [Ghiorsea sp.]